MRLRILAEISCGEQAFSSISTQALPFSAGTILNGAIVWKETTHFWQIWNCRRHAFLSSLQPKILWNLWHWVSWFKYKVNTNICFGAAQRDVHTIADIIVHDLTLELSRVIISKPLASKLLKGHQLWPKALV